MDQCEFVESCLVKYRHEIIPRGQNWEVAHYPTPKCKGGTETIMLWSCDHSLQGLLQSEEFDHPCIHGYSTEKDKQNLSQYYPEHLPLLDKWLREKGVRAGKMTGSKTGVKGGTKVGAKNGSSRSMPVLCVELNRVFPSMRETSRSVGCHRDNIQACCVGKRRTAGGLHWRFTTPSF